MYTVNNLLFSQTFYFHVLSIPKNLQPPSKQSRTPMEIFFACQHTTLSESHGCRFFAARGSGMQACRWESLAIKAKNQNHRLSQSCNVARKIFHRGSARSKSSVNRSILLLQSLPSIKAHYEIKYRLTPYLATKDTQSPIVFSSTISNPF